MARLTEAPSEYSRRDEKAASRNTMASTIVSPLIRTADYCAFQELLQRDPAFPRTHLKWACQQIASAAALQKHGVTVALARVDPLSFAEFCIDTHRVPSVAALSDFAEQQETRET